MQPLHPIPRVDAGDAWAFDFVGLLPKTAKGNQYLLTAMDLGTDWAIAQALPRRSSESVAEMLRYIIFTYGKPMAILTDNGEEFLSYHVQNLLRRFGIHHLHMTPYHPQTNGRLEKLNDVLMQMLVRMTVPVTFRLGLVVLLEHFIRTTIGTVFVHTPYFPPTLVASLLSCVVFCDV
jgi:transposase InsO family protein